MSFYVKFQRNIFLGLNCLQDTTFYHKMTWQQIGAQCPANALAKDVPVPQCIFTSPGLNEFNHKATHVYRICSLWSVFCFYPICARLLYTWDTNLVILISADIRDRSNHILYALIIFFIYKKRDEYMLTGKMMYYFYILRFTNLWRMRAITFLPKSCMEVPDNRCNCLWA